MPVPAIRHLRLGNQRLTGRLFVSADEVVSWFGAVQAQEYAMAKWALAQRSRRATSGSIDGLLADGAIVRTHILRPTWHFVAPQDFRWMMALSGPRVQQGNAGRYRELGLDTAARTRGNDVLARALEGGRQLTRHEAAEALRAAGIATDGQRLPYLLMNAELEGVACSGGLRGKQHTYALVDDRIPPSPPRQRDEAVAELVRRYFVSHGPAVPQDFVWWSGLTLADTRRGIEINGAALKARDFDGRTYWSGGNVPKRRGAPAVALLPIYDEYLIAYRHRADYLDPAGFVTTPPPTAFFSNIVAVDGYIAGRWDRAVAAKGVTVELSLFTETSRPDREALEKEAARYAAFLGLPLTLSWSAMPKARG